MVTDTGSYVGPAPRPVARRARPRPGGRRSRGRAGRRARGPRRRGRVADGVRDLSRRPSERLLRGRARAVRSHRRRGRLHRPHRHRPLPAVHGRRPAHGRLRVHRGALPLPPHRRPADGRAGRRPGAGVHQRRRRPADARRAAVLGGPRRRHMLVRNVATRWRRNGPDERRRHELHGLPRVPAGQPGRRRRGTGAGRGPGAHGPARHARASSRDFALPFIDGNSRFTTGQFVAFAGGWV